MDNLNFIITYFNNCKLPITEDQAGKLLRYYEFLVEYNEKVNLTAITDFEDVVKKHFADSAALLPLIREKMAESEGATLSLIDVGTGAGFPGMVLKILEPELKVTLLDSLNKGILFLEELIRILELDRRTVVPVHGRAEDTGHVFAHREKYDFAVSRAVANLTTLSEYCIPFVKQGGSFVAYKSQAADEELAASAFAIKKLGGDTPVKVPVSLPDLDAERNLIVIPKIRQTPKAYPRKAGTPAKSPLAE
ncbi:MAG: 16S rRNA (guanine(527)-N(7))-methyltransferase RsmG [Lachnospiraceae bacterium]|nr:16S rRNA (guanine(527)-N(7))-methyltransferase RsmG [Lachnospiraceae bacterium]